MSKQLESFYEKWSCKPSDEVANDVSSALRKSDKIIGGLESVKDKISISTLIDFGCGYGTVLDSVARYLNIEKGYGFDFSQNAINYANKEYGSSACEFYKLKTLDVGESISFIKSKLDNIDKVDCILLIDLLEHIPDCVNLVAELSKMTKYFIIKLPLEESVLDNYILPKQRPGPKHTNGHLREFNVNSVYSFIRELGLTPLFEEVYVYNIYDTVPPQKNKSAIATAKYIMLRFSKLLMSYLLPKRAFLRLIGGGGYWCIATYNENYRLNP